MVDRKKEVLIGVGLFVIFINLIFISAADTNVSLETKASLCLNESKIVLDGLISDGFSYQRVNDSLKQLQSLYNAQIVLKTKNSKSDFNPIISGCADIKRIRDLAYSSRDELNALDKFYNESTKNLNTSEIDKIINSAKIEMVNERYEKIDDIVQNAYKEIANAEASQTTLNLFYQTTTAGLKSFLNKNWKVILGILILLIVILIIYKKTISVYIIKKKIAKLELRKETIKKIMMKTQKDYFQSGNISEGEFSIKTNKLGELIRDIERQIPLLMEELAKIDKVKK